MNTAKPTLLALAVIALMLLVTVVTLVLLVQLVGDERLVTATAAILCLYIFGLGCWRIGHADGRDAEVQAATHEAMRLKQYERFNQ